MTTWLKVVSYEDRAINHASIQVFTMSSTHSDALRWQFDYELS